MPDLPSGTVTFLFTDIEGSMALWERDRAAMREAVARQLTILHSLIAAHHGVLYKTVGDGTQAAFGTAEDALRAALASQRALLAEAWVDPPGPLRVRMALHTAAATPQDRDYLAPGLNRLARLLAASHGGQVLLSLATQDLGRDALPAGAGLRDLGEHPLRDLYRPERVFQLLHPDLPADFPSLRTLATRPNNLPLQPTPFLGREDQVTRVVDLLGREDVRLLTITGPGGVGKTRVALQAGADMLEAFPDGVWFVDLSVLDDPALVSSAIAGVLGVREEGSGLPERLASVLGGKRLLLVLDNFERVTDAAQTVSDLLARVPGLKVLATSRTPLYAYGEHEYPLPPLPLPDLIHLSSVERMSQYEAVRLFIAQAQAVNPDFAVTNANAQIVAEICYRLDGLPLAIELAAARVKVLPPAALLKRLDHRLPLLTGGARTLPARQQTMRNTIAWSHDLLSREMQTLFRQLAVFAGGFTLHAAEAVTAPEDALDVLEGISLLIDNSLLRQEDGRDEEPRFRMLETIREFGLEQLHASGEESEIRRRHAIFFQEIAERADVALKGAEQHAWLNRLALENDNLRSALGWLIESDAESGMRFARLLYLFWLIRGYLSEGREWLERALSAGKSLAPAGSVPVLNAIAALAGHQGDFERATTAAESALATAREIGDAENVAWALQNLSNMAPDEKASLLLEEALELTRQLGNKWRTANILHNLAVVAVGQKNYDRARALLHEELKLARELGDIDTEAMALANLGVDADRHGQTSQAAAFFRQSLVLRVQLGTKLGVAESMRGLALVAESVGQLEKCVRLLAAAEAIRESVGAALNPDQAAGFDRVLTDIRKALGETAFSASWEAGNALGDEEAIVEALALADELAACGDQ
jgi:predicted ATPase/class 3 adenylate cyclase/Tfp pilus assembly protein PilF